MNTKRKGANQGWETDRLLLVRWSDEFADEFERLCADGDAMRFVSGGRPIPRDLLQGMLARTNALWAEYGFGPWAAIDKQTSRWVGRIGLNLLPEWPRDDEWEVGYELAREFWGQGLATEGARRAIRFGWEETTLTRIISVTRQDHLASRRVMEKCGLTLREQIVWKNHQVVCYAIDRPDADYDADQWPEKTG